MPMQCGYCSYHTTNEEEEVCPECDKKLSFTMLGPRGAPAAAPAPVGGKRVTLEELYDAQFKVVDAMPAQKTTQISAAIGMWFVGMFIVDQVTGRLVNHAEDVDEGRIEQVLWGIYYFFILMGSGLALGAGAIAAASCKTWFTQGLAVGLVITLLPLLLLLVLPPDYLMTVLSLIVPVMGCTLFGAYCGHNFFPPARVQKSLADRR